MGPSLYMLQWNDADGDLDPLDEVTNVHVIAV